MIKTRFAPSPTGFVHIGSLRTALYAYLFARKKKGHLILRIEDTDQTRFVEGAQKNLIRTLEWAGIHYEEGPGVGGPHGPYIQSERYSLYQKEVGNLLINSNAYRCFCSLERLDEMRKQQQEAHLAPMYDKKCRYRSKDEIDQLLEQKIQFVIRLAIPENETLRFRDLIRGDVQFDSNTIDDQVLVKSDGFPTYHLANVVDDHHMEVTHVIRGEEWLPSTPKHIYLYRAFKWEAPAFAHIPLLLNKDRSKLSKRQNDVAVEDYIKKGYLPEAMVNFVALLGWNPGQGETQEVFSMEELIERFNLEKVHKSGAVFDPERLDWFNGHYIRSLPVQELAGRLYPWLEKAPWFKGTPDDLHNAYGYKVVSAIQSRIKRLDEAPEMLEYLLKETFKIDNTLFENEKMNIDRAMTKNALTACHKDLSELSESAFENEESIKNELLKTIERLNLKNGQVLWPLRVALTGKQYSPGAFEMATILGKKRTLKKIKGALCDLAKSPPKD